MPVAPDLLLQARPEVKPKAPVAKAPEKPEETSKSEASSFAKVYAKERQSKAPECSETTDKPASGKADETEQPASDPAAGQQSLADSGKPLPAEGGEAAKEEGQPALDPLLLMAMSATVPPPVTAASPVSTKAEVEDEPSTVPVSPLVVGAAPATPVRASPDQLDAMPAVKMALEQEGQTAQAAQAAQVVQQVQSTVRAVQTTASIGQDFASALAAFADKPMEIKESNMQATLPSTELSAELAEGLGENKDEVRNEILASRLSALSQAISQQSAQAQRVPTLVPGQPVAMQQGGWSEAVVDRVMWLSSQNLKSAEIQLDPADLGRLEVRVHMTQDQAQVTFASPNANVRDALEGQMHRLRDLFAQQGMGQLDVNVSDQSLNRGWQGQGGDGERRAAAGNAGFGGGGEDEVSMSVSEIRPATAGEGRGLVDFYA